MSDPSVPPPPSPYYTPPPAGPGAVSPNRSLMIVLSYIWLVNLVPLVTEKNDPEVQWHAKHGLVLMLAEWAVLFVLWMVHLAVAMVFAPLGCVFVFVQIAVWVGCWVLNIICMFKGVNGQRFLVPGVSQYADRF